MKRPFNPWPLGVIAAFVVFIAGTIGLVVLATSNRMDLVAQDYYEQELRYQKRLEGMTRAERLPSGTGVALDDAHGTLLVHLPAQHAEKQATGWISLVRPSQAGMDRRVPLQLQADGSQSVDLSGLRSGNWKVRVEWQVAGEEFTLERGVVLQGSPP